MRLTLLVGILLATALAAGVAGPGGAVATAAAQGAPQTASSPQPKGDGDTHPAAQHQNDISLPLPRGKKLFLTDGTFQIVREYQVEGDRVRYWSVERSQWEEIPVKLIDWDATHKAEAEQAKQEAAFKAQLRASDLAARTKDIDVDRSLEIKPGLFLPDGVGFYALQGRLILAMKQSLTTTSLSKSLAVIRILSGIPMIPNRQNLEIPGEHSAFRVSTAEPEFYMRPADDRDPHLELLHAQVKGGHRLLEFVNIHDSGERTRHEQEVPIQTWTPARGVFRYTVEQRLEPGEYAFVEIIQNGISEYVWDFGVDAPGTKTEK
jgi:hypothetical protein